MLCGSRGLKTRLAKGAGAEPPGKMRDEKTHPAVVRSNSQSTFGSWDVEKCTPLWREAHSKVKTCQNRKRLLGSKPFLGAEMLQKCLPMWCEAHMRKTPHARSTFDVEQLTKCTLLWPQAHLEVKSIKNWLSEHFWTLRCGKSACCCGAKPCASQKRMKLMVSDRFERWDASQVHAVVAQSTFASQSAQNWRDRTSFGSWDGEKRTQL